MIIFQSQTFVGSLMWSFLKWWSWEDPQSMSLVSMSLQKGLKYTCFVTILDLSPGIITLNPFSNKKSCRKIGKTKNVSRATSRPALARFLALPRFLGRRDRFQKPIDRKTVTRVRTSACVNILQITSYSKLCFIFCRLKITGQWRVYI